MISKKCKKCLEVKSLTDFTKLSRNSDGRHEYCKACKRQIEKDYFHNNPKAKKKRAENNRKFKYGISVEEFNQLLIAQNYCCAICDIHLDEQTYNTTPRVDHCHSSKKVRGLLCGQCNVGLGHFYENENSLFKAIEYLRKHR